MADLDSDGILDLLSGSWPGELYWFRGTGGGAYEGRQEILGFDGWPINPGAKVEKKSNGDILITGVTGQEEADALGERKITFRGKTFLSTPSKRVMRTGCATHVNAVDWDADGDLDLLIGDIEGRLHLIRATGPMEFEAPEILELKAGRDAGPTVYDWDGDGDFDLLIGTDDGSVVWFENLGIEGEPKFVAAGTFIHSTDYEILESEPTRPGIRTKVAVTDWNGDGKLDLLVGDASRVRIPEPERTPEEQERFEEAKAEFASAEKEWFELAQKLTGPDLGGPDRETDPVKMKPMQDRMIALAEKMNELRAIVPREEKSVGWVWLYEQI